MQHSTRMQLPQRRRSVRAARVRATLHMLHTQRLSRSPQTVPINTEAADQTCWSAACAYARRREKRPYLVAGVHNHHAPSGYKPDEAAGHGRALCSRPGAALLNIVASTFKSRETPPARAGLGETFGFEPKVVPPLAKVGWTPVVVPYCSSMRAIIARSRLTSSTNSSTTRSISVCRSRAPRSMLSRRSSVRLPAATLTNICSYNDPCQGWNNNDL